MGCIWMAILSALWDQRNKVFLRVNCDGENNNTNNIPENAADIISPNLQESMRSNNQRAAIINHQKHK